MQFLRLSHPVSLIRSSTLSRLRLSHRGVSPVLRPPLPPVPICSPAPASLSPCLNCYPFFIHSQFSLLCDCFLLGGSFFSSDMNLSPIGPHIAQPTQGARRDAGTVNQNDCASTFLLTTPSLTLPGVPNLVPRIGITPAHFEVYFFISFIAMHTGHLETGRSA